MGRVTIVTSSGSLSELVQRYGTEVGRRIERERMRAEADAFGFSNDTFGRSDCVSQTDAYIHISIGAEFKSGLVSAGVKDEMATAIAAGVLSTREALTWGEDLLGEVGCRLFESFFQRAEKSQCRPDWGSRDHWPDIQNFVIGTRFYTGGDLDSEHQITTTFAAQKVEQGSYYGMCLPSEGNPTDAQRRKVAQNEAEGSFTDGSLTPRLDTDEGDRHPTWPRAGPDEYALP